MKNLRLDQTVIVTCDGVHKVGVIIDMLSRQKRRVYNVMLENGSILYYVRKDNPNSRYYINMRLTDLCGDLIVTNIDLVRRGNFA
jgi:hypothetical protein